MDVTLQVNIMTRYRLSLQKLPEVASDHYIHGHWYRFIISEPYQRRDGVDSHVLYWHSKCKTCGESFHFTTGMKAVFLNKRCFQHRKMTKAKRAEICLRILREALKLPADH